MCTRVTRPSLIIILVISLFGCQLLNQNRSDDDVLVDDLELQSNSKQDDVISIAISRLERGKTQDARAIIDRVLRINPQHNTAKLLVRLLDLPAKQIFETNRTTTYKIKAGDTLGSIAERWLGNSIYFVSLAQLNKLNNPMRIKPGMTLKIPVISSSPLVKRENRRSRANLGLLKQLNSEKKYYQSLNKMNELFAVESHRDSWVNLQRNTLELVSQASVSISDRHEMVKQISRLLKTSHRNWLKPGYQQFIQTQKRKVLIDEFLLLFEARSYLESAAKLIEANKTPAIDYLVEETVSAQETLIKKLHEEAIILRKDQQLNQAMLRWEKIIAIDPKNELAKKYYTRTSKLLNKLKRLN